MSLKIEDVMIEEVVSVPEKAAVRKAAELMNKHEIGCLVVVKKRKPVGIVTETDMVRKVILGSIDPKETNVGEIMSQPLVVGNPEMDVDEAARIMRTRKIKKLPVVKKGRLVGLITTTDMVRSPEVMRMMIRTIERNILKEVVRFIEKKLEPDDSR
ncbi:MAG: CBS domain-containing protein [Candidatus Bathyarchaeota archaeon]|nr:MAG: CBS domain-containing protein [Candidatus Bathyarchaeota archaeon]